MFAMTQQLSQSPRNARAWAALACALLIACDSGGEAAVDECTQGAVSACIGTGDCIGEQTCSGTPARLGRCVCDDVVPDAGEPRPELGAPCTRDDQCPAQSFCLTAESRELFGGAPPAGTCVADCTADLAACDRFTNAICVDVTERTDSDEDAGARMSAALCFERCELGAEAESDCHARDHVACAPLEEGAASGAFCRPVCANDGDCAAGSCDPRHGVCRADAQLDRTFGQTCDPEANATACDGLCVKLSDGTGVCSSRCVFGNTEECAPATGNLRRGACVIASEGGAVGDLGYCGELCDCSEDCGGERLVCSAFSQEALAIAFGRKGHCTSAGAVTGEVVRCVR